MRCPDCGAAMVKERGLVSYEALTRFMDVVWRWRLSSFWSCYTCGQCVEAINGN